MVRLGILNDRVASSMGDVEEERAQILREVGADWAGNIKGVTQVWASSDTRDLADAPALDMLVVDYGALARAYGSVAEDYTRAVRVWADDHPGALVILWTGHTAHIYTAVFEEEFGTIGHAFTPDEQSRCWCSRPEQGHLSSASLFGNVLFRYAPAAHGGYVYGSQNEGFWDSVRAWFGLPPRPARGRPSAV